MDLGFLAGASIFKGLDEKELKEMFDWLGYIIKSYSKGETVLMAGQSLTSLGIVLSGSVNIENNDVWGNKTIFDNVVRGQVFGEVYACAPSEVMMVDVVAAEKCEIIFLSLSKLFTEHQYHYSFQDKMLSNLLKIMSSKNLILSRKISFISSKSIRDRIISYLSFLAISTGSRSFEIPFNRQQLSDFLCVDRSALSNELSKMQKEGLLKFNKNKFEIISEYDFDIF